MKKLPSIYKNKIKTVNNKLYSYSSNNIENIKTNLKKEDINSKINRLLNNDFSYSKEVIIVLNDREIKTRIINKVNDYILTIDNSKIKINNIIDIKE